MGHNTVNSASVYHAPRSLLEALIIQHMPIRAVLQNAEEISTTIELMVDDEETLVPFLTSSLAR